MNPITLRHIAIASAILTVLLALDGLYMILSNYKPDDTQNNTLHMSDGTTVLVAAALLLIVTVIAYVLANRTQASGAMLAVSTEGNSPEGASTNSTTIPSVKQTEVEQ